MTVDNKNKKEKSYKIRVKSYKKYTLKDSDNLLRIMQLKTTKSTHTYKSVNRQF